MLFGGYRVQGRTPKAAKSILADAVEIQDAGASLLVLECIPAALASDISRKLDIPVIGIGAGAGTDAQVLVMHDLLASVQPSTALRQKLHGRTAHSTGGLRAFVEAVKSGAFPHRRTKLRLKRSCGPPAAGGTTGRRTGRKVTKSASFGNESLLPPSKNLLAHPH
jgi:3-methyl-2-oxobutanoate hydroxymethyltransferase